jgi:hypothetical protein
MEKISRTTLAKYAATLGRQSIAGQALRRFDVEKEQGRNVAAYLRNNGFAVTIWSASGIPETVRYG